MDTGDLMMNVSHLDSIPSERRDIESVNIVETGERVFASHDEDLVFDECHAERSSRRGKVTSRLYHRPRHRIYNESG
jgi:hypothetical protein